MKIVEHLPRAGDFFFKWRSYLPLLFLPVVAASFIGFSYPYGSRAFALVWEVGCFFISVAGVALRSFTVGTAPAGTSGRNTRAQKARALNTTGPYSVVRHPLYVGNYVIALGIALVPRVWFLPIMMSLAFLLYYERIAAREEEFLELKFGDEFRVWASRVPAMIPSFGGYRPPALPFSWRVALGREYHGFFGVIAAMFILDAVGEFVISGRISFDLLWTAMFLSGALFFVTVRFLRKRTSLLKTPGDRYLDTPNG